VEITENGEKFGSMIEMSFLKISGQIITILARACREALEINEPG
jgi:hypothetical protein